MVKKIYGWQPTIILVREKGTLVGGLMLLVRKHSLAGPIGFVTRGPITKDGNPTYVPAVLDTLCTHARRTKLSYVVVVPPFYVDHRWVKPFHERGFFVKPRELPPTGLVTATLVIDLSHSLESIQAHMTRMTRCNVRKGCRDGFVVRKGSYADIPIFWDLMVSLCHRRGISPVPERRDFFENLWRYSGNGEAVQLFLCEYEKKPVSGLFGFSVGRSFRGWKVGWNGEHRNKRPNHLIWWEAIKWAKANGFKEFDFVQIIPEHAEAVLEGREVTGWYAGATAFKLGFGGELILSPEPLYSSFNPCLRAVLQMGGHHMLASKPFRGALRKFGNRFLRIGTSDQGAV